MNRRAGCTALIAGACLSAGLLSAACSAPAPNPPGSTAPEAPSQTPTPVSVDVGTAAVKAATTFLTDNGYTVSKASGYYLTFSDGGDKFSSKMTCEGGQTTHIGWQGICAAPNEEALGVVVATRVTAGPKIATVAMEEDVAASCGDGTMPEWVTTVLKTAKGQYCFLNEGDG